MTPQDGERLGRAMEMLFSRLGPNFKPSYLPHDRTVAFALVEKVPRKPDGSNWHQHGKITWRQSEIMAQTSQTAEEIMERMDMLLCKGVDTTGHLAQKPVAAADMDAIINQKVEALLRSKLDEILNAKKTATAQAPVRQLPKQLSGLQSKPKRSGKKDQAAITEQVRLWTERALILGIREPLIGSNTRRVDGRWLLMAERRWAEHCAGEVIRPEPVAAQ